MMYNACDNTKCAYNLYYYIPIEIYIIIDSSLYIIYA